MILLVNGKPLGEVVGSVTQNDNRYIRNLLETNADYSKCLHRTAVYLYGIKCKQLEQNSMGNYFFTML